MEKNKESGFDGSVTSTESDQYPSRQEIERRLRALGEKHNVNRFKLQLKVDFCVITPICVLYLLAFLDRINISNAQVYGLSSELGLVGNQYNTALVMFFVPYVVFEIPSNLLLKRFKPHVWLSICLFLFGAVTLGQGFVKSYHQLLATRFLLGLMEAGMFPGCFYLMSTWYRRDESQKRYSFFFASTSIAGAFGGLIAYAVHHLNGHKGLSDWRWLFIIEGAVTCFIGIILFFTIADFPEDAKFISENERAYIREKLAWDQGESNHEGKLEMRRILEVFKDPKLWLAALMYFGQLAGAYGYAYFATAIIKTFKYSAVKTQVYSIFPWICACGAGFVWAILSDALMHRYAFTLAGGCVGIAGYAILLGTDVGNISARYAACFLICLGMYASMPLIVCWTNMNFAGHYRKLVGTAFQVQFGNLAGIIATWAFLAKDAPKYKNGVCISMGLTILSMISAAGYLGLITYENKKRRAGECTAAWEAMSPEEQRDAGDRGNPNFIYQQ